MEKVGSLAEGLVPKSEFIGLENMIQLAAGGETPMLKSHREAVGRFMADKALAETRGRGQKRGACSFTRLFVN